MKILLNRKAVQYKTPYYSLIGLPLLTTTLSRIKKLGIMATGGFLLCAASLSQAAPTTIPVDLAGANATKHEIAVLQVLSEVCPPMLNSQQRSSFFKTYNHKLHELLPTINDPKAAIHYLSTQQDYKTILTSMRSLTMGEWQEDNMAICSELANETL